MKYVMFCRHWFVFVVCVLSDTSSPNFTLLLLHSTMQQECSVVLSQLRAPLQTNKPNRKWYSLVVDITN